ncbi:MAG: right-handed parallel beta-helix repeat-containing protein [bacterium]|nr:right-handed parallel beta-helix repeat-containing protein [bacterium]MDI1336707.1 right-handed parallel beta-helix repeat-containing protein [Lacunisphaera sp.]
MPPLLRRAVPLAFILLGLTLAASGAEYFVSPTGRDTNTGTRQSPFLTLERARDEVRAQRTLRKIFAAEGHTIWLRGGTYPLARTFELGPRDAGVPAAPLVISACEGETVRLTGGLPVPVAAFQPVRATAVLARLPAESRGHVLVADLRALGVTDFGKHRQFGHGLPVIPSPMELLWNDTALTLARYPNEGAILMGEVIDPGSMPRNGDYSNRPGRFKYTDPRHARWARAADVWLQGYFHHGYADDKIRVAAIDPTKQEITLASPHLYALGSGENFNAYVALNLLEELDQPGEWYVDATAGQLYLWPPGDLGAARIVATILEEPLIALENTTDCQLRNLIIEDGRGLGVYIEGGARNRVTGCTIRNLGTVGVMLGQGARQDNPPAVDDYLGTAVSRDVGSFHAHLYRNTTWERNAGRDHRIEHCDIYNTGSGGIILGGGSKKNLTPGNNTVSDCRIHEFSRRNKSGAAGVVVDGCGNHVTHCEIFDGDLQAIIVHGNEHLFDFNRIHHVARNSNDASAWYLGRDPSDQGNVVRANFFSDVGRPDRKWTMGVYCDDATCGVLIEQNVFLRVASYGSVYSNGGHDITVRNNIFIGGYGPAFLLKSMWYDFAIDSYTYYFGPKGIYTKRLTQAVDIRTPPYSTRYPGLRDWLDLLPDGQTYVGMRPRRNTFSENVLVKFEETFRLVGQHAQCDYGDNYLTNADPGFVNAAALDFRLQDDSPVFKALPKFSRIPFGEIGPRP